MPKGRHLCYIDYAVRMLDEETLDTIDLNERTIFLTDHTGYRRCMSHAEVAGFFNFEYTSRLQFLHESDFRGAPFWAVDNDNREVDVFISGVDSIGHDITAGKICDKFELRYIGEIDGVDIGYGAFATDFITCGTLIGEYVGILASTSEPTQYSLSYPSCTGAHEVNASTTGNMMRFINHSSCPNCSFRVIMLESLPHVVCIASRDIQADEQITVSYGAAFWHHHAKNYATELKEIEMS